MYCALQNIVTSICHCERNQIVLPTNNLVESRNLLFQFASTLWKRHTEYCAAIHSR
jgi:hypothetical protein